MLIWFAITSRLFHIETFRPAVFHLRLCRKEAEEILLETWKSDALIEVPTPTLAIDIVKIRDSKAKVFVWMKEKCWNVYIRPSKYKMFITTNMYKAVKRF